MKTNLASVIFFLTLTLLPTPSQSADSAQLAEAAANVWLAKLDQGHYEDTWKDAAKMFRDRVGKEDWKKSAETARGPLGKVSSRKLKGTQAMTSLPGAPDGEYVVIQYQTSFEKKKDAVETVTPMKDPDGKWRVSGYFIR